MGIKGIDLIRAIKYSILEAYRTERKLRFYRKSFNGLSVSRSCNIDEFSVFEGANSIGERSFFSGSMGYGSYMAWDCYIIGNIGRFSSIGPYTMTNPGIHPLSQPYATTSPMFFSLQKQTGTTFAKRQLFEEMRPPIRIGNDCWIGQNVFIVGGATVNDGAVVLAGAVVTKDVPPYAIVGGVPAKIIKYRYDDDTIKFLLDKKWWNMPIEWLKENSELFCDIDRLKEVLNAK